MWDTATSHRPRGSTPFSLERWPHGSRSATIEVAAFVARETGRDIDRQYIYRIRADKVKKVDGGVLEAIALFFGKPLGYFSANADDEMAAVLRELVAIAQQVLRDEAAGPEK